MSLATNLRKKGIIITEYENKGKVYRNKWIDAFMEYQNKKLPYHNFLWELIDSNYMDLLEKKEANNAFDRVNKQYCYIFFQKSNDVLQVKFASAMKARDLFNENGDYSDVYVVDKGFNWTYVIPHEVDYGPYFYRKRKSYLK